MSAKAVMVPQKYNRFINLYWEDAGPRLGPAYYATKCEADNMARKERIACLKITVTTDLA
jgi:hypothetical protein